MSLAPERIKTIERLLLASMPAARRPDRTVRPTAVSTTVAEAQFNGFMFVADDSTVRQCLAAGIFGGGEPMLATMRRIGPQTLLFIHNQVGSWVHGSVGG